MKGCLHTPEGDRVAHGRFDEVGQSLALLECRLEFGMQFGLDANLGDDSSFHRAAVLRLGYRRNESDLTGPVSEAKDQVPPNDPVSTVELECAVL